MNVPLLTLLKQIVYFMARTVILTVNENGTNLMLII